MRSYAESIVDTYCEITGFDKRRFRSVPTPHIPESSLTEEDLTQSGELDKDASRILMRLLWLSRLTRPDLAFIVTRLAGRVTAWTRFEDRQLHRCVSYLNSSTEVVLTGSVSHKGGVRPRCLHRCRLRRLSPQCQEHIWIMDWDNRRWPFVSIVLAK